MYCCSWLGKCGVLLWHRGETGARSRTTERTTQRAPPRRGTSTTIASQISPAEYFTPMLEKQLLPASLKLAEFRECLARYDSTISAVSASHSASTSGKTLEELDKTRRLTLPPLIRARNPPYLTKPELIELLQCKLFVVLHLWRHQSS